jgi:hypothetical protein
MGTVQVYLRGFEQREEREMKPRESLPRTFTLYFSMGVSLLAGFDQWMQMLQPSIAIWGGFI